MIVPVVLPIMMLSIMHIILNMCRPMRLLLSLPRILLTSRTMYYAQDSAYASASDSANDLAYASA